MKKYGIMNEQYVRIWTVIIGSELKLVQWFFFPLDNKILLRKTRYFKHTTVFIKYSENIVTPIITSSDVKRANY